MEQEQTFPPNESVRSSEATLPLEDILVMVSVKCMYIQLIIDILNFLMDSQNWPKVALERRTSMVQQARMQAIAVSCTCSLIL